MAYLCLHYFRLEVMQNGTLIPILDWIAADKRMIKLYKPSQSDDWTGILWHGNPEVPRDSSHCGWPGELCEMDKNSDSFNILVIVEIVGGIILLFIVVSTVILVKRYRFELVLKEVKELKVKWCDVQFWSKQDINRSSVNHGWDDTMRHGTLNEEHVSIETMGEQHISFQNRVLLLELKNMRDIQHENMNAFIGLCTDSPNVYILMSCPQRGSLTDVLANKEIHLGWEFKIAITADIVHGLRYLHKSSIGFHGNLKSTKCVLNHLWTCKITGYGLQCIRKDGKNISPSASAYSLWSAPEILNQTSELTLMSLRKADVYSFGIIVQEIVLEMPPYSANEPQIESEEIMERVKAGTIQPYRPYIPPQVCSEEWRDLMTKSWKENPESRPSFVDILRIIKRINGGELPILIDTMITRLEQHTRTLEEKVLERNKEVISEKSMLESLLCELLPKAIVDELKMGGAIQPETFDACTIFFSDIVGFTRISAKSTPTQIVELLNNIYSAFDEASDKLDVYKVATIGDAYMVASGVPIRNGDNHASEICSMALTLLKLVKTFAIAHLQNKIISLRSGIHSGSCIGAVVGIKMPRYLLFGETVNVASKMESSGLPMKIQVSQSTQQLVKTNPKFTLLRRWKFDTNTYWLCTRQCVSAEGPLGEHPVDCEIPQT